MSAIVFRVRRSHDIWVAGKASHTIVLPSSLDELILFLGDPVHRLVKLLVCIFLIMLQQEFKDMDKGNRTEMDKRIRSES